MREDKRQDTVDIATYNAKIIVREHTSNKGSKYFMAHIQFIDGNGELHRLFEHFVREHDLALMEIFSNIGKT